MFVITHVFINSSVALGGGGEGGGRGGEPQARDLRISGFHA